MTGARARSYHDRSRHSWQSVRGRAPKLDWSTRPLPYKSYPDLPPWPLPVALAESGWPALDALSGERPPGAAVITRSRLAALLFYTAGITRRWDEGGRRRHFRAASSAGALYPIETYAVVGELDGIPAGVYHFSPLEFALRRLRGGDHRPALATAAASGPVARAPVSLVFTGLPWRTVWKYGLRGYRHLYWDCGTMLANLLALTTATAVPARVVAGFVDDRVGRLLALDADRELPLAVVPVGAPTGATSGEYGGATPDAGGGPGATSAPTRVPAGGELDEVLATHRAGNLATPAAVELWRSHMRELPLPPVSRREPPPTVAAYDSLEEIVLRRGAARRFARAGLPAAALRWPLSVAGQQLSADFLPAGRTLLTHHAIVHAVDEVPAGVYRWQQGVLEPQREGSFRQEAAQLCLEQPLGGDGGYTVFHAGELQRLLAGAGERAYRAVLLEGGVALGRAQLAASALGLGASGLTFYDDDVAGFLGLDGEPVTVTAVGVPAYRPRPGRRPASAPAPPRLGPG